MDLLIQEKIKKRLLENVKLLQALQEGDCPISYENRRTCLEQGVAIVLCNNPKQWFDARALYKYWKQSLNHSSTLQDPVTRRPVSCVDVWVVCHMIEDERGQGESLLSDWRKSQWEDSPLCCSLLFRLIGLGVQTCRRARPGLVEQGIRLQGVAETDTLTKIMRDFPKQTHLQEWLDCTPPFLLICPPYPQNAYITCIQKFLSDD